MVNNNRRRRERRNKDRRRDERRHGESGAGRRAHSETSPDAARRREQGGENPPEAELRHNTIEELRAHLQARGVELGPTISVEGQPLPEQAASGPGAEVEDG